MRRRRRKNGRIRFSDRVHPKLGIMSLVFAIISIIVLVILCLVSSSSKGHAGIAIGVFGLIDLIVSAIGFFMAIRCYPKEDIYRITPAIGSVLNGLVLLFLMILYVAGTAV